MTGIRCLHVFKKQYPRPFSCLAGQTKRVASTIISDVKCQRCNYRSHYNIYKSHTKRQQKGIIGLTPGDPGRARYTQTLDDRRDPERGGWWGPCPPGITFPRLTCPGTVTHTSPPPRSTSTPNLSWFTSRESRTTARQPSWVVLIPRRQLLHAPITSMWHLVSTWNWLWLHVQ